MTSNISDQQFLEGDDLIVVQSDTSGDYEKANTKTVKVESLREDIRNYVEATTTKELKVFRSTNTAAGGRIDVLDNETLYYYPATPVSSLEDKDVQITSLGSFFDDVATQQEFNEKIQNNVGDIEFTLNGYSKYLDALVASTEFDDNVDPTHVFFFTNYNAYPPTPASPDKAKVVNVNDLTYVDEESAARDADLQNQITDQEKRITALFNVKINSGYFIHQSDTPTTEAPEPGQIKVDTNVVDPTTTVFSIHARSYTGDYIESEDQEQAFILNNYIVVQPGDNIITGNNTYQVVSVEVVDGSIPLEERVYIFSANLLSDQGFADPGDFTVFRIVTDGEFDPGSLDGEFVKIGGDTMTGQLSVQTDETTAINIGDGDGNVKLTIRADGSAITTKSSFTDTEFVTKAFVEETLSSADLDAYVKKTGDTMSGHLEIRGEGADGELSRLKCNILDSGQQSNLTLKRNNVSGISINNGSNSLHQQTVLDREGTIDKHLVTKKYVDDKVSTKASSSHSHSYASSDHNHGNAYVKAGSSDSSPQNLRIWKSGSLYYIS